MERQFRQLEQLLAQGQEEVTIATQKHNVLE